MTSSLFHPTLAFALFHSLAFFRAPPLRFRSTRSLILCHPNRLISPALPPLCVIQSSQGDGYPSPRSAYTLHFRGRLIRLIDCPNRPPRSVRPFCRSRLNWRRRVHENPVCIDIFVQCLLPPAPRQTLVKGQRGIDKVHKLGGWVDVTE